MNYKLLLLAAAAALVVYSCSSDRDEVENPTQSKDEFRIENIENNREESSKTGDSTVIYNPMSTSPTTGLEPQPEPENPDPSEGGDPKNVPIPPRR